MALAADRASTDRATATFAPEQIGRTRYRTPEGFLVCEGVRIARTGPMMYSAAEMPDIELGSFGGMITIERDADVLFEPDCVMSYAGKPVTNDHPPEPVTPANAKQYSVGTVLNPRRGDGVEDSYLLGDLLITDETAIAAVETGKVELSAGYDIEVEQIAPGIGRQTKNVGNHVALVERGRAGPACAIQDAAKEPEMAKRTTRILDGIRKAFKAKDEAALEESLGKAEGLMDDEEEGDGEPQRVIIEIQTAAPAAPEAPAESEPVVDDDPAQARFAAIEASVQALTEAVQKLIAPPAADAEGEEKDDPDTKVEDEDPEAEVEKKTASDAIAKAEILAPGVRLPAFDAATVKNSAVTALRRKALTTAYAGSHKAAIDSVLGGRKANFDAMPVSILGVVFDAAAALARDANNGGGRTRAFDVPQGPMTAAKMQARILERRKRS